MNGITFALPGITDDQMDDNEQRSIIDRQVIGMITCCYLEHRTAMAVGDGGGGGGGNPELAVGAADLAEIITTIKTALVQPTGDPATFPPGTIIYGPVKPK